jgi:fatty-acyl-CoA synthase
MMPGLEPGDDEICCSPLPLHHIGALVAHALALACIAGTYVMLSEFTARQFVDAALRSRATILGGVPTVYLRVLDELPDGQFPDVRVLMLGGSSIPPALVSRLEDRFGARVSVMYGQSEAPAISQTRLDDSPSVKATTVGRALPLREIRIADAVTGGVAATGQVGEICVRTPVRMERYLNRPDATTATIDEDGWLHTGDLGSLDDDGLLSFHGRLRDMIVRGGENVYALEVENAIESHPDVAQAVVVGLPDARWGETVAAAVVPRAGAELSEGDLTAVVAQRLAHYKRPTRWTIVEDLPMTASGKPQKFKIVETLMVTDAN